MNYVHFLFPGEQADVDEVGEAEVTLKEGSIIIHEWKNQCKMNFSGELKDLEPNTEYSLWVTEASTSGCPDLNHEPTELTAVCTLLAFLKNWHLNGTPVCSKVDGYLHG